MPGKTLRRGLHKTILGFLLLVPFCAAPWCAARDWNYEETRSDARDFVAGGLLHVQLTVGDLHIRRGDSNVIKIRYTVKSSREGNLRDARVDFDVHGGEARIEFHSPYRGNTQFDVEIEVPGKTNLEVHSKVGDMTVEDIEGDKDLTLGVGDIHLNKMHPEYRVVHASTGIGDVDGDGYGTKSGWLGKTLKYRGDGRYELRAHVGVGDIRLEGK